MIPTRVGQRFGGGVFAGVIRVGESAYGLIVAPKHTERSGILLKTHSSETPGTQSVNDGSANTRVMLGSEHPSAECCLNLRSGGYSDWYLPSRDEMELCYRHLKPTTSGNWYSEHDRDFYYSGNLAVAAGFNPSSIPVGCAYTPYSPCQTLVTSFCKYGSEEFNTDADYWSSTEYSAITACGVIQDYGNGRRGITPKSYSGTAHRVRAARRVLFAQGGCVDSN